MSNKLQLEISKLIHLLKMRRKGLKVSALSAKELLPSAICLAEQAYLLNQDTYNKDYLDLLEGFRCSLEAEGPKTMLKKQVKHSLEKLIPEIERLVKQEKERLKNG
jgi:hypothetical protein